MTNTRAIMRTRMAVGSERTRSWTGPSPRVTNRRWRLATGSPRAATRSHSCGRRSTESVAALTLSYDG